MNNIKYTGLIITGIILISLLSGCVNPLEDTNTKFMRSYKAHMSKLDHDITEINVALVYPKNSPLYSQEMNMIKLDGVTLKTDAEVADFEIKDYKVTPELSMLYDEYKTVLIDCMNLGDDLQLGDFNKARNDIDVLIKDNGNLPDQKTSISRLTLDALQQAVAKEQ